MEWFRKTGESIVNALGNPDRFDDIEEKQDSEHSGILTQKNCLLDISSAKKVLLLENGVVYVISNENLGQIFVDIEAPFKKFLDLLDAQKAASNRKASGQCVWTLFNIKSNPYLYPNFDGLHTVPYREKWRIPTNPPDVLLLGAYMAESKTEQEIAVIRARGEEYYPVPTVSEVVSATSGKEKKTTTTTITTTTAKFLNGIEPHVSVAEKFGSHSEIEEYISKKSTNETVVATPEEWKTYHMLKLILGTELTFFSLLRKWCDVVQNQEFTSYDIKGGDFDYIASLRHFIDDRALFGHTISRLQKQSPENIGGVSSSKSHDKSSFFEGLRASTSSSSSTKTSINSSPLSRTQGRQMVSLCHTLVNEYESRQRVLIIIEERKEQFLCAVDELLNEYKLRGGSSSAKGKGKEKEDGDYFMVPRATMNNLLTLRDQLEVIAPELFHVV